MTRTEFADRSAFEKWLSGTMLLQPEWDEWRNCYKEYPTHLAWKGWQAALREQAAPESAQECVTIWGPPIAQPDGTYIRVGTSTGANLPEQPLGATSAHQQRDEAAVPHGYRLVPEPRGMRTALEKIGIRLREHFRNRFSLTQPTQLTDNERQVIVAALDALLFALFAPTIEHAQELANNMLRADDATLRWHAEKLAQSLWCVGPYHCGDVLAASPNAKEGE